MAEGFLIVAVAIIGALIFFLVWAERDIRERSKVIENLLQENLALRKSCLALIQHEPFQDREYLSEELCGLLDNAERVLIESGI